MTLDSSPRLLAPGGAGRWARSWAAARRMQLENVVHRAEQGPLVLHRPLAAPEKLPEAPGMFDLPEDRLNALLSLSVALGVSL